MNLLATSPAANDRRLTILTVASVVFAVCMVVGGAIALPRIISSASTTRQLEQSSDLQACRAGFRTLVDDATAALAAARADLDLLTNAGLEASVTGDDATLLGLVASLPEARDKVSRARRALDGETAGYRRRVTLSRDHPRQFLAECDAAF